jgi:hypothetical protein
MRVDLRGGTAASRGGWQHGLELVDEAPEAVGAWELIWGQSQGRGAFGQLAGSHELTRAAAVLAHAAEGLLESGCGRRSANARPCRGMRAVGTEVPRISSSACRSAHTGQNRACHAPLDSPEQVQPGECGSVNRGSVVGELQWTQCLPAACHRPYARLSGAAAPSPLWQIGPSKHPRTALSVGDTAVHSPGGCSKSQGAGSTRAAVPGPQ